MQEQQWDFQCRIDRVVFVQESAVAARIASADEAKQKLADAEEEIRRLRQILCELLRSNQILRLAMIGDGPPEPECL